MDGELLADVAGEPVDEEGAGTVGGGVGLTLDGGKALAERGGELVAEDGKLCALAVLGEGLEEGVVYGDKGCLSGAAGVFGGLGEFLEPLINDCPLTGVDGACIVGGVVPEMAEGAALSGGGGESVPQGGVEGAVEVVIGIANALGEEGAEDGGEVVREPVGRHALSEGKVVGAAKGGKAK